MSLASPQPVHSLCPYLYNDYLIFKHFFVSLPTTACNLVLFFQSTHREKLNRNEWRRYQRFNMHWISIPSFFRLLFLFYPFIIYYKIIQFRREYHMKINIQTHAKKRKTKEPKNGKKKQTENGVCKMLESNYLGITTIRQEKRNESELWWWSRIHYITFKHVDSCLWVRVRVHLSPDARFRCFLSLHKKNRNN